MTQAQQAAVRPECLQPARLWMEPTAGEIRLVLDKCGFTRRNASIFLGIEQSGRSVGRWLSGEHSIPYSAWALLCARAGLGYIWEEDEGDEA
ncbi:XRE family transcriptional regulator (plasmid) [Burkholderia multivorans]|nr:XRE family transcriptional regulator [Burkholderia multivorans]MCO1459920.1 XRE family transcriptional regulator [Burkholderia multivorans]UQO21331.1 XRE family transcriptional regulator [Burkholderia multivorans]